MRDPLLTPFAPQPFAHTVFSFFLCRFTNSGTEACMGMLRLCRAFTSREKIIKFEVSNAGTRERSEHIELTVKRKSETSVRSTNVEAREPSEHIPPARISH